MNIPVELFQNLTSSFGEDFLRISSCPYSARNPHSSGPCFWRIKISRTFFEKGHQRNIPVKLFQNLTSSFREDFLRISSCPFSARSPHLPDFQSHGFGWIKILRTIFEKGHQRNIPVKLFQIQSRRFLKNCLKNLISLPWQPEFLMESNSVNNF